jgi:hypothetical protein
MPLVALNLRAPPYIMASHVELRHTKARFPGAVRTRVVAARACVPSKWNQVRTAHMPKMLCGCLIAFSSLVTIADAGTGAARASVSDSPTQSAAPGKDNVTRAARSAWRKVIQWPDDCEESFDSPDPNMGGMSFYALGRERYLVEVVCTLGAYQGYQRYYLLDESNRPAHAAPLTFTVYEAVGERGDRLERKQSEEVWGTPEFDAKARRLTVLNRFRAIGDCGTLSAYTLEQDRPRLKELRAKVNCDGRGAENPKLWPKQRVSRAQHRLRDDYAGWRLRQPGAGFSRRYALVSGSSHAGAPSSNAVVSSNS